MSKESIQSRADFLSTVATFQWLLDEQTVETVETCLLRSNVAVASLVTQMEGLLEGRIATLTAKAKGILDVAAKGDSVDPGEIAAFHREMRVVERSLADNAALLLNLKWPTGLLNRLPAVAAKGALPGDVAPLPDYLLFPGGQA